MELLKSWAEAGGSLPTIELLMELKPIFYSRTGLLALIMTVFVFEREPETATV